MDRRLIADLLLGAGSVAGYFVVYAVCRLLTRPAAPAAGPAVPDLGPEPPAVVGLLVNRWAVTADAALAVVLDLAARGHLQVRASAAGPEHTTVWVPIGSADRGGLRPYERQVLDRIDSLAFDGVVPVPALTFRDQKQARAWNTRLRRAIVDEARAAGLSRRRFGRRVTAALVGACVVAAGGVAFALSHYLWWNPGEGDGGPGPVPALFVFFGLLTFTSRSPGERHTAAGRAAAARWLGVGAWLRANPGSSDVPPAFAAALGVVHPAAGVLDFGMGDRRLVWSSYGGTWHPVRVRYPRVRFRYGRTASTLVLTAVAGLVAAAGLLALTPHLGRYATVALVAGAAFLLAGTYTLIRTVVDPAMTLTRTGEVLWAQVWRTTFGTEDTPPEPWLHHLAIDDGTGDRTTAWALPSELASRCHEGDTVTIRARPWSRRVTALTVVRDNPARRPAETVPEPETDNPVREMLTGRAGAADPPVPRASELFAPADIDEMFERAMVAEDLPMPPPLSGAHYRPADGRSALLMVQIVPGAPGEVAWRTNRRGTELPGGAWTRGDRAAFRYRGATVVLTLLGAGRERRGLLPWLVRRAVRHSDRL